MEFDDIVVKESPGLCRCCLSEGCYKDMGTEYAWMNENEVYADMLLECFDISISQHNDGPNGPNRLICEVCITRLRDACYFKKQVLASEKKFVNMLGRGLFAPKTELLYQSQFKAESSQVEVSVEADVEYLDDDIDYVDDDTLKEEEPIATVSADPLPVRGKRGRPRKGTTKTAKKVKVETKAKTSKALVKELKTGTKIERQIERERRIEVSKLAEAIIKWSTLVPFRWHNSKYMCFYCEDYFFESSKLKEHFEGHPDVELNGILLRIIYTNYRIKLDITQIWCTECGTEIDSFNDFIDHLDEEHSLQFSKEAVDQFDVFKLDDDENKCLDCGESYKYFSNLLTHTRKVHSTNKSDRLSLCEICGQCFLAKSAVLIHIKQCHQKQQCRHCEQTFTSRYTLYNHIGNMHEPEKLKCPICSKMLPNRYMRKRHLALYHDCKSAQLKCDICNRVFTRNNKLDIHKQVKHFKDNRCACEVCGVIILEKASLKKHMLTHEED